MSKWMNDLVAVKFTGTRNPYMDYSSFASLLGYDIVRPRTGIKYPKDLIKKVIFNNPFTIVIWTDDTKTIVKAEGEPFDQEKGLAMAISKRLFGNTGNYYEVFKKWIPKPEEK